MNVPTFICPICGANNPPEVRSCSICGAYLRKSTGAGGRRTATIDADGFYDPASGEDDLLIRGAPARKWLVLVPVLFALLGAITIVIFGLDALRTGNDAPVRTDSIGLEGDGTIEPGSTVDLTSAMSPAAAQPATQEPDAATIPPTNTRVQAATSSRIPGTPLPTITPTISPTPTQGPCTVKVTPGDSLVALAMWCGHRHPEVIQLIVEVNELACETCIVPGDILEIPRPTPTPQPIEEGASSQISAVTEVAMVGAGEPDVSIIESEADAIIATRVKAAEPTLDPGMMFHTVQEGQTLYDIIAIYDVDVKLLSEINPEIEFAQCDFGERFGGETCSVIFTIGQQIRVPAPVPTATIRPTSDGSETATPTPTATINVPEAFAPQEGRRFDATQLVTLRWTTTGTLGVDEVYLIHLVNLDTDQKYLAISCEQAFELPSVWQPEDADYYAFAWHVSVIDIAEGVPPKPDVLWVREFFLESCELSFALPVDWGLDTTADALGLGIIMDGVAIVEEQYSTAPRGFFWQGQEEE